jgi:hypothetical protein
MSLETLILSIYSDISILIKASSESNNCFARVLAVSVFHTPVGHRNINEPIGFVSSDNQALFIIIALATLSKASSCQKIVFLRTSSKLENLALSVSISFPTGTQVHFDTTLAISSAHTESLTYGDHPLTFFRFASASSIFVFVLGIFEYFSSATAPKSDTFSYSSA